MGGRGVDSLRDADEAVDLLAAERGRIGDRLVDAGLELLDAVGEHGDAALATGPVAGRQIVQDLGEAVGLQFRGKLVSREIIGEEVFDALEARLGRRLETIEEADFVEEHGEISREFRHRRPPSMMVLKSG